MSKAASAAITLILALSGSMVSAEEPGKREMQICLQAIRDLTGGNPPARAVKLCQEGKVDAAIDAALSGN